MRYLWVIVFFLPSFLWSSETNFPPVEGKILPPLQVAPISPYPNTYLKDKTNTIPYQESLWRRYDVVFFVAIPISFYLFLNISMLKNAYLYAHESTFLSDMDWNYIYLTTFLVPLFVAYHDQVFFHRNQPVFFTKNGLTLPIYQQEF